MSLHQSQKKKKTPYGYVGAVVLLLVLLRADPCIALLHLHVGCCDGVAWGLRATYPHLLDASVAKCTLHFSVLIAFLVNEVLHEASHCLHINLQKCTNGLSVGR